MFQQILCTLEVATSPVPIGPMGWIVERFLAAKNPMAAMQFSQMFGVSKLTSTGAFYLFVPDFWDMQLGTAIVTLWFLWGILEAHPETNKKIQELCRSTEPKCFDVVNKDVKQRLTSPSELIEEWVETRFFFGPRKKLQVEQFNRVKIASRCGDFWSWLCLFSIVG